MKFSRGRAAILVILLASIAFAYSGHTTMKPEDFKGTGPEFVFDQYFLGSVKATGILFGRNGDIKRKFTALMNGKWEGNQFLLDEDFEFEDGEKQHRRWKVEKIDAHNYRGTADDVVGTAIGKQFGSVINWSYVLKVPVGNKTYEINFDDWMFLNRGDVLINRATMKKFGFKVGELIITFDRLS